ncbi:MAG: MotA/TolQ/ExbB proton channel family protein [Candidatus Dojkabacteria bacterium]|nr:MotA/TolQ/ExbB proton channel family protein [Candidatus Dojkabacteria bacterium]
MNTVDFLVVPFIYDKSYLSILILFVWIFFEIKIGKDIYLLAKNSYIMEKKSEEVLLKYKNTYFHEFLNSENKIQYKSYIQQKMDKKLEFNWIMLNIMIFLGLIGTIVGIIITFYPFINEENNLQITNIKNILPTIFSGLGVAFFPSLASAIFCTLMIVSDRILQNSISYFMNKFKEKSEK